MEVFYLAQGMRMVGLEFKSLDSRDLLNYIILLH